MKLTLKNYEEILTAGIKDIDKKYDIIVCEWTPEGYLTVNAEMSEFNSFKLYIHWNTIRNELTWVKCDLCSHDFEKLMKLNKKIIRMLKERTQE